MGVLGHGVQWYTYVWVGKDYMYGVFYALVLIRVHCHMIVKASAYVKSL